MPMVEKRSARDTCMPNVQSVITVSTSSMAPARTLHGCYISIPSGMQPMHVQSMKDGQAPRIGTPPVTLEAECILRLIYSLHIESAISE